MSNIHNQLSCAAHYLQLDVCGLDSNAALNKLMLYKRKNPYLDKVILHGDWTKKGFSENDIKERYQEYIAIIKALSNHIDILGITIHPPYRNKYTFEDFLGYCNKIGEYTNVLIENRSSARILLSDPTEIIDASKKFNMTIDIPQLYISCNYDKSKFMKVLNEINHNNVGEYHVGNIKRTDRNTFVARKLDDEEGIIDYREIVGCLNKKSYFTLEILGGNNTFNSQKIYLESILDR